MRNTPVWVTHRNIAHKNEKKVSAVLLGGIEPHSHQGHSWTWLDATYPPRGVAKAKQAAAKARAKGK